MLTVFAKLLKVISNLFKLSYAHTYHFSSFCFCAHENHFVCRL